MTSRIVSGLGGAAAGSVVWTFGIVPNAYSSLIIKLPERNITLILLANSDALAAPFSGSSWDVTASAFARTFLKLYIG